MKPKYLIAVYLFVFVSGCFAQTSSPEAHRTNTQIINFILDIEEKQILDVAEAMPHEKYGFVPTAGEFKEVRSFADQLKHIAADNYLLGAGILGEKAPGNTEPGEKGWSAVQTKPEIIAYLNDYVLMIFTTAPSLLLLLLMRRPRPAPVAQTVQASE